MQSDQPTYTIVRSPLLNLPAICEALQMYADGKELRSNAEYQRVLALIEDIRKAVRR